MQALTSRIKRLPDIATRAECLEFLRDLANKNLDFHLEDSPSQIISGNKDQPVFNTEEVVILEHNVEQCYRVLDSRSRCPIYWLMKFADERDAAKGGAQ